VWSNRVLKVALETHEMIARRTVRVDDEIPAGSAERRSRGFAGSSRGILSSRARNVSIETNLGCNITFQQPANESLQLTERPL
jgi:hypothetical protein